MRDIKNTTWKVKGESVNRLKNTVKWIFQNAKKYQKSHKEITDLLTSEIYTQSRYKTLPQYLRYEINGYIHANYDIMYEYVEFCYMYDGKLTRAKDLPYGDGFDQNLVKDGSHYYKGTSNKY